MLQLSSDSKGFADFSENSKEITMDKEKVVGNGIKSLVEKYRIAFRIPENVRYYSKEDYEFAEKQFIRYALTKGRLDFLK
jgi:hypothetical protein